MFERQRCRFVGNRRPNSPFKDFIDGCLTKIGKGGGRKRVRPAPPAMASARSLLFEAFEQRVLMSATLDPMATTALTSSLADTVSSGPSIDLTYPSGATFLDPAVTEIGYLPGSHIYREIIDGTVAEGVTSSITLPLTGDQPLTFQFSAADPTFTGEVLLRDPSGNAVVDLNADWPGAGYGVYGSGTSDTGIYTLEVIPLSGSGAFHVSMLLNADDEGEHGYSDDDLASGSTHDIGWVSREVAPGVTRLGAVGDIAPPTDTNDDGLVDPDVDAYAFWGTAGQTIDIVLRYGGPDATSGQTFQLRNSAGEVVAMGMPAGESGGGWGEGSFAAAAFGASESGGGGTNSDTWAIQNLVLPDDDTYTLVVSGTVAADYAVTATLNAGFNIEPTEAQPLPDAGAVVGSLGYNDDTSIDVGVFGDWQWYNQNPLYLLGDSTHFQFNANWVQEYSLGDFSSLNQYDVIVLGDASRASAIPGFADALRTWVEAGGGLVVAGPANGATDSVIDDLLPFDASAGFTSLATPTVTVTTSHDVTDGLSTFTVPSATVPSGDVDEGASVLATIDGDPAVIASRFGAGRVVYLAPDFLTDEGGNLSADASRLFEQATAWASIRRDVYTLDVNAGDDLTIRTWLPEMDAAAGPLDTLNPRLTLYDPDGNVVAQDTGGVLDNYNAIITTTATMSGTYRIEVAREDGKGDYVLTATGSTVSPVTHPYLLDADPYWGSMLDSLPGTITLHLSAPVLGTSVQAGDVQIDGMAAQGVTYVDPTTLVFDVSNVVTHDGNFSIDIPEGAFTGYDGGDSEHDSLYFSVDTTPPRVTSLDGIADGVTLNAGEAVAFSMTFSEPVSYWGTDSIEFVDLDSGQALSPSSAIYDYATNTLQFIAPVLTDGRWEVRLRSDHVYDYVGHNLDGDGDGTAGDDYVFHLNVDAAGPTALDFTQQAPIGAMIHGADATGYLHSPGDADEFAATLDPSTILSVAVAPAAADGNFGSGPARVRVEVLDSSDTVVATAEAAAAGDVASLLVGGLEGAVKIRVSSLDGTVGHYSVAARLNAVIESTTLDDALDSAIDLEPSRHDVETASRFGATGTLTTGDVDYYAFQGIAGQRTDIALSVVGGSGNVRLDLFDSAGTLVATSAAASGQIAQAISGYTPSTDGTLYVRVSGDAGVAYSLAVARGATLQVARQGETQSIGDGLVFGGTGAASSSIRVAVLGTNWAQTEVAAQLNDDTWFDFQASAVDPSAIDTLDELRNYDVVILGGYASYGYQQVAAALKNFVAEGGGVVATGWTVAYAGPYYGYSANIDAVVPVQTSAYYNYSYYGSMLVSGTPSPVTAGLPSSIYVPYYAEFAPADPGATVLATINGQPAVVTADYGEGHTVYLGPTYAGNWTSAFGTGDLDRLLEQAVASTVSGRSEFQVALTAGQTFTVSTVTPNDADGAPVSTLDPKLELVDADGNVVASDDNSGVDGRNSLLTFTPDADGLYKLRVLPASGSGEFVLNVSGTAASGAMTVTGTTPPASGLMSAVKATYEVRFSEDVDLSTLEASDLTIHLQGSADAPVGATSFTVVDGRTVRFALDGALTGDGSYDVALADGAVKSLTGDALAAYSSSFSYDGTAPEVTGTSLGGDVYGQLSNFSFTFSEPIDANSLSNADITILGPDGGGFSGLISSIYVSGSTVTVSLNSALPLAGTYDIAIGPDVRDLAGNPMAGAFHVGVTMHLPNLQVSNVVAPSAITVGDTFALSWNDANVGDAQDDYSYDLIYLSTTPDLSQSYSQLTYYYHGTLQAGETYSCSISTQLSDVSDGTYYLVVKADGWNYRVESDENDNLAVSGPITVRHANLTVSDVATVPVATPGQWVDVTYTVNNTGADLVSSRYMYDRYFISSSPIPGVGESYIGESYFSGEPLAAGASTQRTVRVQIPTGWTGSTAYIHVKADIYNYQPESNESDNTASSAMINLANADLAVDTGDPASFTAPDGASIGDTVTMTLHVTNPGTGEAGTGWTDGLYLVAPTGDRLLATNYVPSSSSVPAGGAYDSTFTFTLPNDLADGTYQVYAKTDIYSQQPESNETNNTSELRSFTVRRPNLVMSAATMHDPKVAFSGDTVYVFVDQSMTWADAEANAEAMGGHLAVLTAQSENDFVHNAFGSRGDYWIGASDAAVEGDWQWVDGEPFVYSNWNGGEPNNYYDEDYAGSWSNGTWNDFSAGTALPSVVEVPLATWQATHPDAYRPVAGQTTEIDWTVTNTGTGTANADWSDAFYLSQDTTIDGSDTALTDVWVGDIPAVPSGASYSRTISFTMPNVAPGTWYLLARTDNGNAQAETDEADNILVGSVTVDAADLTIASVTAPTAASTGQSIAVSWIGHNAGTGTATADWYDRVYLSTDDKLDASDTTLNSGWAFDQSPLAAGADYATAVSTNVTIPAGLADGTYYLIVEADGYTYQPESNEANNWLARPITIDNSDLTITSVTAPDAASTGQSITVSWLGHNAGTGAATTGWYDRVYLSTDAVLDASDATLAASWAGPVSPLAAGADYATALSTSVTIPPGTADGTYYLIVAADGYDYQPESNETNNWTARQITVGTADLVIDQVTAPEGAAMGQSFAVSWIGHNAGTGTATSGWYDRVYLSTDNALDASDTTLGYAWTGSLSPLAAGADYATALSTSVTIPNGTADGTYYLIVAADGYGYQTESNEDNNWTARQIVVGNADLVIDQVTAPSAAVAGSQVNVSWVGRNIGTGIAAADWYDSVYLSTDAVLDGGDRQISSTWMGDKSPLGASATYDGALNFTLPADLADGTYYVIVKADANGNQPEASEANNATASAGTLAVTHADLHPTIVSAPASAAGGQSINFTYRVDNIGTGTALADWYDVYYVTSAATGDVYIGANWIAAETPLAAGSGYLITASATLPSSLPAGDYSLMVRTDSYGHQPESNETNNSASASITISRPNLVIDAASADTELVIGDTSNTVSWTVRNSGVGDTASDWSDRITLSTDAILGNGDDRVLADVASGSAASPLAAGASASHSFDVSLPAGLAAGKYYVFVTTDGYGQQAETSESDNSSAPIAVTVKGPDLTTSAVVGPSTLTLGQYATVTWHTTNAGDAAAAGNWYDDIYLSQDTTLDGSDRWVGNAYRSFPAGLAAGAGYDGSASIYTPTNLEPGTWYVLVKSDGSQWLGETGEANNVAVGNAVTVQAPDIRIEDVSGIPASANFGDALTVSWTGANRGTAATLGTHYDAVYLSQDATLGWGDVRVADAYTAGAVAAGATYDLSRTFTLPIGHQYASGSWYLIVAGDAYNYVAEGAGESGNTVAIPITLSLPAAPDLHVSDVTVTADPAAVSGSTLNIAWTTTNDGSAVVAGSYYDRVVVTNTSTGETLLNTVVYRDVGQAGTIPAGGAAAGAYSWRLPDGLRSVGDLAVTVTADTYDQIYEGTTVAAEADNARAASITTTLADYPDLTVSDLMVGPVAPKSGDLLTLSWTTANGGSRNAANFSESVEVINQTTGQTLYSAALAFDGTLAAGATTARTTTVRLPDGTAGVGQLLVRVTTDRWSQVYEYNASGTAESNNQATAEATSALAAYPDLVVSQITAPAAALPGQAIDVSWVVANTGTKDVTASWAEQIFVSDDGTIGSDTLLKTVWFDNVTIKAGDSITHVASATLPSFGDGARRVVVKTDVNNQVFELDDANNAAIDDATLTLSPALGFRLGTTTVSETAGGTATVGTVTRSGDTASALVVTLASDVAGVTVPATVTIAAGQSSATFAVGVTNDTLVNGTRTAQLTASASGYAAGTAALSVLDDDTPTLTITPAATLVSEKVGTPDNSIDAVLTRNTPTDQPLTVNLSIDRAYKASIPSTVTFAAGESAVHFKILINNDTFVEGARDIRINATAAGYNSGSTQITINDDDVPTLTLDLAQSTVSEKDGLNATYMTITRSIVSDQQLEVVLKADPNRIRLAHSVTFGAGEATAVVPIEVIDNTKSEGAWLGTIEAAVADSVVRTAINGTAVTTSIVVLDDDGPSLSVTLDRDTIAEAGGVATGTVARNTLTDAALVVTLSSSDTTEATVPTTVTIPAGQSSATFMVNAVADGVTDGTQTASIFATAAGFNSGAAGIQVTDRELPDLIVGDIVLPTTARAGSTQSVSWTIANTGLGAAAGSYVSRVYLSTDVLLSSDDALVATAAGQALAIGETSSTFTANFTVPNAAGPLYVLVVADPNAAIQELVEANNLKVASFEATPAYVASVQASIDQAPAGTKVTLTGTATDADSGVPVAFTQVTVTIGHDDTTRRIVAFTNASGQFTAFFTPLPGETGHYTVAAAAPAVQSPTPQDSFVLLGMKTDTSSVSLNLTPHQTIEGDVTLTNLTDVALTGLSAAVTGSYAGVLDVHVDADHPVLAGDGSVKLHYTVTALSEQQLQGNIGFHVSTDQGVSQDVSAYVVITPLRPQLVATTGYVAAGMLVGQQKLVTFEIANTGGAPTGEMQVLLPSNLPWLSLASSSTIPSLKPGEKATVTLRLSPPADLDLVRYDGSVVVAAADTSVNVAFQFRAISELKGDALIHVEDESTYFAEGAPGLAGATVTLSDPYTYDVVATAVTGDDGSASFTGVAEGHYTLTVSAPKHDTVRTSFDVQAGIVNETTAFTHVQAISYNWTVVPTEIQDHYKIVLETTFETEVPMPVVTIDEPLIVPLVLPGKTTQFSITLRNHGLIDATQVHIQVPTDDPDFIITPLVDYIDRIPAQSEITVPITIRARETSPLAAAAIQMASANAASLSTASADSLLPEGAGDGAVYTQGWGGTIAKCLGIKSIYTYVCKNNQWVAVEASLDPVFCAEDIGGAGKAAIESLLEHGNLIGASCDILGAVLQCLGVNDCLQAILTTACGGIVGGVTGGPAGAALGIAGALGDILGCLCTLFGPAKPGSGGSSGSDGGGGFGGWGGYGGYSAPWSAPVGTTLPPLCGSTAPSSADAGEPIGTSDTSGVCAEVRLRLEQQAVITRTAFLGTLEMTNDQDVPLENVKLTLDIRDQDGKSANDKFVVRGPNATTFIAEDGGLWTLPAKSDGSIQYTFVPTVDAAVDEPERFQIGGVLEYDVDGQHFHISLVPGQLTVYPEAQLVLNYFWQRDVYADDPFTDAVEPSEPFALGLEVTNVGKGGAKDLTITSAQPQIVENEKGLLIDFQIVSSQVNAQAATPSLTVDLGYIAPGATTTAQWNMTSSLQGKFKDFTASFTHEDDNGDLRTSLIKSVAIHELIRSVEVTSPSQDNIPDYLVNDIADPDNTPDTLYMSTGGQAPVFAVEDAAVTGSGSTRTITASAVAGWSYIEIADPAPGMKLKSVVRSDGVALPIDDMVWRTDRTFKAGEPGATYENLLHILDYDGTGSYTLTFVADDKVAPTVSTVGTPTTLQTGPIASITVTFSEPLDASTFTTADLSLTRDGTALDLSAATITDLGGGAYRIGGLADLTGQDGNYTLTVDGHGVTDPIGNAGTNAITGSWATSATHVVATAIGNVTPDPHNSAVSSLDVTFSRAIDPSSFDLSDLSLTRDGTAVALTGVTIVSIDAATYRVAGLSGLTGTDGAYTLAVDAAGVQDAAGVVGAGRISESWTGDFTAPSVAAMEQPATNPRNTVVRDLDVTFSEAIDPSTFDYHDVTLTRNGGANLVTPEVTVEKVSDTIWRIKGFNWVSGLEGEYALTVDGTGIRDLAGNAGKGSATATWTMDTTRPTAATNVVISPDTGVSPTDGATNATTLTVTGDLPETGLAVRITDETTGAQLGYATVTGQTFTHSFTIANPGKHDIRVRVVDPAGNLADTTVSVFLDTAAPFVTSLSQVSPDPRTTPVDSVDVTFSEAIDEGSFTLDDLALTRDGTAVALDGTVTIAKVSDTVYRVSGLAGFTGESGAYVLTVAAAGIKDRAGNAGTGAQADDWTKASALPTGFGGYVFDDFNANGLRDVTSQPQELPLAGWTVFIDADGNGQLDAGERSTVSAADGAWQFVGLSAGTYRVVAELRDGWYETVPTSGAFTITVAADEYKAVNYNFGRFRTAEVSGTLFSDLNADGVKDSGETGLSGWTVFIDANANSQLDPGEASQVTADDGSYHLTGLHAGTVSLGEISPNGWLRTTPAAAFKLTSGLSLADQNVGNVQGVTLAGTKFEDVNGDGIRESGESGLSGWTIFLDANQDGVLQASERSTVTDADGRYSFDMLFPGAYTVAEVQQDGWMQTSPLTASTGSGSGVIGTAGSDIAIQVEGCKCGGSWVMPGADGTDYGALSLTMADQVTALSAARADSRFSNLDGSGVRTVIIDTGIDVDHSFFGPDLDGNGIADRIVYEYDFADGDADASDHNGHGSHIASLIASSDATYTGVAPDADLIVLKVFSDNGTGTFKSVEKALQWVIAHADEYNIGVVNMSLGDSGNWTDTLPRYGLGDEFATLAGMDIITVAAAGNHYNQFNALGVAYPASDPAVIAVGSSWSGDFGGPWRIYTGAIDYTTGADRIAAYSQRDPNLIDTFAPGSRFNGANATGGVVTMQGTSQASAFVSGAATLVQQLAEETLGHRLSTGDFAELLRTTGDTIFDGDDEDDNVSNSGVAYKRLDFEKLFQAVLTYSSTPGGDSGGSGSGEGTTQPASLAAPGVHTVTLAAGQTAASLDFGNFKLGTISGTVLNDRDGNGTQDAGEAGLGSRTVWLDDGDGLLEAGERTATTAADGSFAFANVGPGVFDVREVIPAGWTEVAATGTAVTMTSGLSALAAFYAQNPAPTAVGDAYQVAFNRTLDVAAPGVLANDADAYGDTFALSLLAGPAHGTLTLRDDGSFSYAPENGYAGADSFAYRLTDSAGNASDATVSLTVLANRPPVARADAATRYVDAVGSIAVLGNDSDPDPGAVLHLVSVTPVSALGAAVSIAANGTTLTWDPSASAALRALARNEPLDDTFTYVVADQYGATAQATVTVHALGVNDAPAAAPDAAATDEDTAIDIAVLANDRDPDHGAVLSFEAFWAHSTLGATITRGADGSLHYDPTTSSRIQALGEGQQAVDTFDYRVVDQYGSGSTTTVTVALAGRNDAPVAKSATATVSANQVTAIALPTSGFDIDAGDALVVSVTPSSMLGAALSITADGRIAYDPRAVATLSAMTTIQAVADTVTFTVTDKAGRSSSSTLTLTVRGTQAVASVAAQSVPTAFEMDASGAPIETAGLDGDAAARLRRFAPTETTEPALIDLETGFSGFDLTGGDVVNDDWRLEFLSQFDPSKMALANASLKLAVARS